MEAFRLLKQCRIRHVTPVENKTTTKTIVSHNSSDEEAESYFDLEFPITSDDNTNEEEDKILFNGENFSDDDDDENDEGLKFTLLSNDDENVKLSPSNELILPRNSVHLESSTILFQKELEDNSKSTVSSLKSPSKFHYLLLKLKKSKPVNGTAEKAGNMEKNEEGEENQEKQGKPGNGFFAVYRIKVEEMKLPLVSLFTRDNNNNCSKEKKGKVDDLESLDSNSSCEERNLSKEMVQKYLKMVKPLYVQLTKNYIGRIKLSGHLSFPKGSGSNSPPSSEADVLVDGTTEKANKKQGNSSINNLQAGLKIVKKHLRKSRSDTDVVAVATPSKVVDYTTVQLQDEIQGAIMHCKKSLSSCNSSGT